MILDKIKLVYDKESPWVRPGRIWQKWYPKEVPKTIEYPVIPVYEVLDDVAEELPNNVAINFVLKEKKYTYKEFYENANRIANGLHQLGVKEGDAVAIMTSNVPEYFFSQFGILKTGAGVVPINSLLRKKEVTHIITDSKIIRAIIVQDNIYSVVKEAAGNDIHIIVVGDAIENTSSFSEILQKNSKLLQFKQPKIHPKEDLAALLYTGGTTGLPKGVFLTHYNALANILQAFYLREDEAELLSRRGKSASVQILPVCHSFGFATSLLSIYAGAMILLYDRFDPGHVLEAIESYKIEYFAGVVTMYKMFLAHPDFGKYDMSSIKVLLAGGGPLPYEIAKKVHEKTGLTAVQGFGLTECVAAACLQAPWFPANPKTVGIPIIDTDLKIVDIEKLTELEPGSAGEILIRGPQVMKEYFNKPDATKKVLIKDKNSRIWLRTGDIGMMDEDGLFYIVGRTKEMIKYKEYRILPREVEETLYEHPAVLECAVIGVPDELAGENILAFISLRKEFKGKITENEFIHWAKDKMAAYKYPRFVKFVRSIPKTPVGKIDRRKLSEKQ
ncbi:MAG: AMP-binding protein [Candidatus Helarchaeota archaeon]|nr:AMP-binding protein [Candidatus Helarchaeota archaeon]